MYSAAWQAVCGFMTDVYETLDGKEISMRQLFGMICQYGKLPCAIYQAGGKWRQRQFGQLPGLCAGAALKMDRIFGENHAPVALHLNNSPDWPVLFWALLMSGRTPLLLNGALPLRAFEKVLAGAKVQFIISCEDAPGAVHPGSLIDERADADMALFEGRWADQMIFMTSGTSGSPKLLVFDGKAMARQIQSCRYFYRETTEIAYPFANGALRQLALLPFSHIFGFVICVIWYPFFGRAIVYPAFLHPEAMMETCREQRVTHLCAVPSYYDMLALAIEAAARKMLGRGAEDFIRYLKNGGLYSPELLQRYREYGKKVCAHTIGSCIRYLISGGGMLSRGTAGFFNRLGLYFCNGYGMTELGILSVELSQDADKRMQTAIGAPSYGVSFQIDEEGQLMVDCPYAAIGTLEEGGIVPLPRPYPTQDLARMLPDGRYILQGRKDDIIIDKNGNRLHPAEIEETLRGISCIDDVCVVFLDEQLIAVFEAKNAPDMDKLAGEIERINGFLPLSGYIHGAYLTQGLPRSAKGEIRRSLVKEACENGMPGAVRVPVARKETGINETDALVDAIVEKAAELLGISAEEISPHANFFTELGGDSLSYICLTQWMEGRFQVKLDGTDYQRPDTLYQWAVVIKQKRGGNK